VGKAHWDGVETVSLEAGDLRAVLGPALGGSVLRFDVVANGQMEPIFRPSPADADHVLQTASFPVVPFANRVRGGRFVFGGREIRLAPNMGGETYPLHGQGWRARWRVDKAGPARAELSYTHVPGEWPWRYLARQVFSLSAAALEIVLTCRNMSETDMPCGLGQHPYFPCNDATVLDLKVAGAWTVDSEVLPVVRVPAAGRYDLTQRRICGAGLDNGFDGWNGRAEIAWPDRGLACGIRSDGTRFQVYAPEAGGFFVGEPVSNQNAALNLPESEWGAAGIVVLKPGALMRFTSVFEVRRG
jgi:aldose 1-epimerase